VLVLTLTGALTASTTLWILVAVLFLGGIQLVSIGVLGRYLAHVHDQVLGRPLYLVSRVVNAREQPDPEASATPATPSVSPDW
jgi:dolichol-phosphate mannosyltransferase